MSGPSYNSPGELLGAVYTRHGKTFLDEPRCCEGLLRDYFPGALPDIAALLVVLKRNIPQTMLLMPPETLGEPAIVGFAKQVAENSQISADAARRAVAVWAAALGLAAEPVIPVAKPAETKPPIVPPPGTAGLIDSFDWPALRTVTKPPVGGGMRKFAVAAAASGGFMSHLTLAFVVLARSDIVVGRASVSSGLMLLCILGFAIAWLRLGRTPYAAKNRAIVARNSVGALALDSLTFSVMAAAGAKLMTLFYLSLFAVFGGVFLKPVRRARPRPGSTAAGESSPLR
jgi:hypothetical protein